MRRYWLSLQSLALAVLLTWPVAREPSLAALGSKDGDVYKHLWTLWWMRKEWTAGTPGLVTTLVNPPKGMELWPIEPLNGLLLPLLPHDPILASNLLALLHLFLVGICGGWLGGLVSRRPLGAWMAGAMLQCSAFTAFTLQAGVGELRQLWWLPLGLGCVVQARDTGLWRWYAAVGACLVGSTLSCFYHGFFLATATLVYALCTLSRVSVVRFGIVAVVATVAVAVPVRSFTRSFDPENDVKNGTFTEWMDDMKRATLETYPGRAASLDHLVTRRAELRGRAGNEVLSYEGGRYLGLVALLLGVAAVVVEPRRALPWVPIALVGVLFSLGTVLRVGEEPVSWGGGRVVLPLAWLNRAMSYYIDPINFPSRFLALPAVALAVLTSLLARWRFAWALVVLACLDLVTGELVPWPRPRAMLPDVRGLERAPGTGAVANLTEFVEVAGDRRRGQRTFPLDLRGPSSRARLIAAQLVLDRPFDSIPIERLDRWAPEAWLWLWSLPLSQALADQPGEAAAADPAAWRQDLWLLRDAGYDSIIVTHATSRTTPWAQVFLDTVVGTALHSPSASIWAVPEVQATEEETATWRAAQEVRAKAMKMPKMGPQNKYKSH